LKQKKLNRPTRGEIAGLKVEKLDAKTLIRKYVADFAACHTVLKDSTEWVLDQAGAYIEDAYVLLSRAKGGDARSIDLQKENINGDAETFHLKRENPATVKNLRARWRRLPAAARTFVSSEPIFEKDTFLGSDASLWVSK